MSVFGIAIVIGIALWLIERKEIAATRQPAPCHICYVEREINMVRFSHGYWVHADTGQRLHVTKWDIDIAAMTHGVPMGHYATPRTARDERLAE